MSYDLMVFSKDAAPKDKKSFRQWYTDQTEWTEDHNYDDPVHTSAELQNWYQEMKESYPPMNGPFASEDDDNPRITDYAIGNDMIYASFAWSQAEKAYPKMLGVAGKHKVGFFDLNEDGDILIPDGNGNMKTLVEEEKQKGRWKFWK